MQSNSTPYIVVLIPFFKMPIHISINETEYYRFITHKGLIVTFTITYRFFVRSAVFHFPEYTAWFPVFISFFFYCLYPIIRYIHSHTIIKSHTSVFIFGCKARHSTNFFSDSYCLRVNFMYKFVGKSEITYCIIILMSIIIVTIITESLPETMTII